MSKKQVSSYQERLNEINRLKRKNEELQRINDEAMRAVQVLNKCIANYRYEAEKQNDEILMKFEALFQEIDNEGGLNNKD